MAASPPSPITVLVTGGSGFVASYVILELLSAGYTVRSTVRSLSSQESVISSLKNGGASEEELQRLSLFTATLEDDTGWSEAVKGCKYVHHVASPFPIGLPKHEDDLILPAREGTLRVLRAAVGAGSVTRVIMTSSFSAVENGNRHRKEPLTEEIWTILDDPRVKVPPYMKSKTIAERAAWAFIADSKENMSNMELSVVIPVLIQGPALSSKMSTSLVLIQKLIDGSMPGCPNLAFPIVDVRDVASLHMLAMTQTQAAGHRFIGASNEEAIPLLQLGKMIKAKRPDIASKIPSFQVPNFVVYLLSRFDKPMQLILPDLGVVGRASNKKARTILGWQPRSTEQCVLDTVDSLIEFKLV